MSDLSRKAYEQYRAKWLEENGSFNGDACFACYKEFLDNEYQDPKVMKYYLDEKTYKIYENTVSKFSKEQMNALADAYKYLSSLDNVSSFKENYLKTIYQIYSQKRFETMSEGITDYLINGDVFNYYPSTIREKRLQDNLVYDIIDFFDHRDIEGAANSILNYFCDLKGKEFKDTKEYKEMTERSWAFTSVLFSTHYIVPILEVEDDDGQEDI